MKQLLSKGWFWALAAVAAALLFEGAAVRFQYSGDWTGLFHSGDRWKLPEELLHSHRLPDSVGYDGQFYRLAAHDPFNKKGYSEYMDSPVYRRNRALIPLLAWIGALGRPAWIDAAYIAVINGFVFLGVWLLAELARSWAKHPAWGLAFLFMPASLNSIDRMLPDIALLAAMAAYLLWRERSPALAWTSLASGALVRELGLLVLVAAAGEAVLRRRWFQALAWASAAVPAGVWWAYCQTMASAAPGKLPGNWLGSAPLSGFFLRLADPIPYNTRFAWVFQALDGVIMVSLPLAAFAALWCWWRKRDGPVEWQALCGASLAVVASDPGFLSDSASYPRAFSLLLCPLALIALQTGRWVYALPCALLSVRLALALGGILLRAALGPAAG